jgi:hypothetical protein
MKGESCADAEERMKAAKAGKANKKQPLPIRTAKLQPSSLRTEQHPLGRFWRELGQSQEKETLKKFMRGRKRLGSRIFDIGEGYKSGGERREGRAKKAIVHGEEAGQEPTSAGTFPLSGQKVSNRRKDRR